MGTASDTALVTDPGRALPTTRCLDFITAKCWNAKDRGSTKMTYRPILYFSLVLIGLASFLGAYLLPVSEAAKTLAALPFVGALFAALFQLLRDHTSFVKETIKQQREHAFLVAATSHMSAVIFDKHVAFCEAYITALQDILGKLFAEGPSPKTLGYMQTLYAARREYRLWVSPLMASAFDEFESKLLKMGSSFHVWEAMKHAKGSDKYLDEAYTLFTEIMNVKDEEDKKSEVEVKKRKGYDLVFTHLQEILGIENLTKLRDSIIVSSHDIHSEK